MMRSITVLAVSILTVTGLAGPAASPALATAAGHAKSHGGHGHMMNISFASGPHSSAHWLRKQQAVQLSVGADTGSGTSSPEFAEIVVHHFPATAPAQEPAFTVTGPGLPYLQIGFTSGGYLRRAAGDGSTAWTAYDSTNTALAPGTDYAAALATEQGNGPALTVDQVILADAQVPQGAAFTDTITSLQYNGVTLVPRTHRHAHHSQAHPAVRHRPVPAR